MHIAQPRVTHYDSWGMTVGELLAWGDTAKEKAELALTDSAPFVAGEAQCRWCVVKDECPALNRMVFDLVGDNFVNLDEKLHNIEKISNEEKRIILDNAGLIVEYINAIKQFATREIIEGRGFVGYKMVEGRSVRKWNDEAEEKLTSIIGDKAYSRKLIGITEAKKLLGKDLIDSLLIKPKGKPALVPETDKRDAYVDDAVNDFDEVM